MKVLAVGGGGREHAAVEALFRSGSEIYAVMKNANPGIIARSKEHLLCDEKDIERVCAFARENRSRGTSREGDRGRPRGRWHPLRRANQGGRQD